jgi:hypothetical protein
MTLTAVSPPVVSIKVLISVIGKLQVPGQVNTVTEKGNKEDNNEQMVKFHLNHPSNFLITKQTLLR